MLDAAFDVMRKVTSPFNSPVGQMLHSHPTSQAACRTTAQQYTSPDCSPTRHKGIPSPPKKKTQKLVQIESRINKAAGQFRTMQPLAPLQICQPIPPISAQISHASVMKEIRSWQVSISGRARAGPAEGGAAFVAREAYLWKGSGMAPSFPCRRGEKRLMDDATESSGIDQTSSNLRRNRRRFGGDNADWDNMAAPAMDIIGDTLCLMFILDKLPVSVGKWRRFTIFQIIDQDHGQTTTQHRSTKCLMVSQISMMLVTSNLSAIPPWYSPNRVITSAG